MNLINAMYFEWLQQIVIVFISANKQLVMACCENRTLGTLRPLRPLSIKRTLDTQGSSPSTPKGHHHKQTVCQCHQAIRQDLAYRNLPLFYPTNFRSFKPTARRHES